MIDSVHLITAAGEEVDIENFENNADLDNLKKRINRERKKKWNIPSDPDSRIKIQIPDDQKRARGKNQHLFLYYDSMDNDRILIFTTQKNLEILR